VGALGGGAAMKKTHEKLPLPKPIGRLKAQSGTNQGFLNRVVKDEQDAPNGGPSEATPIPSRKAQGQLEKGRQDKHTRSEWVFGSGGELKKTVRGISEG